MYVRQQNRPRGPMGQVAGKGCKHNCKEIQNDWKETQKKHTEQPQKHKMTTKTQIVGRTSNINDKKNQTQNYHKPVENWNKVKIKTTEITKMQNNCKETKMCVSFCLTILLC